MSNHSAREVRDLIIDRIAHGVYPLGSKLPTTLELASETGAHKNTVAKAYRALAELGLITLKQGRGTFVASLIGAENRKPISTQIQAQLADLFNKARMLGLTEDALRQAIEEEMTLAYRADPRRAAFVECNPEDVRAAVDEIEAMTGHRLTPLLLDELRSAPHAATSSFNAVFTSLFHIKEVSDLLGPARPGLNVIGIYTHPDEQALSRIARIKPESRVGIVCNSDESSRRFAKQITTFADVTTTSLVHPSNASLRRLAGDVETIVCSRSCASQVQALNLGVPIIPLPFHVSQQSAGRVSEVLAGSPGKVLPGGNGRLQAAEGVSM